MNNEKIREIERKNQKYFGNIKRWFYVTTKLQENINK